MNPRIASSEKPESDTYTRDIWSKFRTLPVIEPVRVTGLSYSYCNHIKNGRSAQHQPAGS